MVMDMRPHFGRGFPGPMDHPHQGGPSALAWTIFALQLVIVIGLAVLLVRSFAGTRTWRRREVVVDDLPAS